MLCLISQVGLRENSSFSVQSSRELSSSACLGFGVLLIIEPATVNVSELDKE